MSKGFTLAEVLITLGIIGIVAAMTIPNLLQKNYEKRAISQLRETQSILAQAVKMAEDEYGDVEGWGLTTEDETNALLAYERLKSFFKIAVDCGTLDTDNLCIPKNNYYRKDGNKHSLDYANAARFYKFVLLNGSLVFLHTPVGRQDDILGFYVDINGKSRPNTIGSDLFYFIYGKNALRPLGAPASTFPYKTKCLAENTEGWGCAYYVLTMNNMNYLHTNK